MTQRGRLSWKGLLVLVIGALTLWGLAGTTAEGAVTSTSFQMIRSAGLPRNCVPNARADVRIVSNGPTETMTVNVRGLPANTDFDFFVIQQPGAPFGMARYQGDIQTGSDGRGTGRFIGRFSIETFIVAPGSVGAPTPHGNRDASSNPTTKPVHTFHLGLWFNSPADSARAHCPNVTTPFNGDHTAGPQVLNTHNFGNLDGPLNRIRP
jgi:hypothetical protein